MNKISKNAKTLLFPANNGPAAVNVTHFCLWDAAAGGRASFGGPLTSARNIQPEDELVIYPNNLEVTVS